MSGALSYACEICGATATKAGREFQDARQVMDHLRNKHPGETGALDRLRKDAIKAEKRERLSAALNEREKRETARKRAAARIVLTGGEVDEILAEMESLIGMMEPYWAQGDCYQDARDLEARLEARLQAAMGVELINFGASK